jgi:hypothetical protein
MTFGVLTSDIADFCLRYAKVCTITGPAIAVAGPASSGVRLCSIHVSTRLFDSAAPA